MWQSIASSLVLLVAVAIGARVVYGLLAPLIPALLAIAVLVAVLRLVYRR